MRNVIRHHTGRFATAFGIAWINLVLALTTIVTLWLPSSLLTASQHPNRITDDWSSLGMACSGAGLASREMLSRETCAMDLKHTCLLPRIWLGGILIRQWLGEDRDPLSEVNCAGNLHTCQRCLFCSHAGSRKMTTLHSTRVSHDVHCTLHHLPALSTLATRT